MQEKILQNTRSTIMIHILKGDYRTNMMESCLKAHIY